MGKEKGIQVQEAQRTPFRINKNRSTPCHIIMKLAKYKDKERILKAAMDKWALTCNGKHIRIASDGSTETWQAGRECQEIFNALNRKIMQQRILYPERLSFRIEGEIKAFLDKN